MWNRSKQQAITVRKTLSRCVNFSTTHKPDTSWYSSGFLNLTWLFISAIGADCHDVDDQHWINGHPLPVANPMSMYPQVYIVTTLPPPPPPSQCHISFQYQAYRKSWGINAMSSVIVEVETNDGTTGVGKHMILCTIVTQHSTGNYARVELIS